MSFEIGFRQRKINIYDDTLDQLCCVELVLLARLVIARVVYWLNNQVFTDLLFRLSTSIKLVILSTTQNANDVS